MTSRPFVLDAYAARSCPLKTVNAFNPRVEAPDVADVPPPVFFHDADGIEDEICSVLSAAVPDARDHRVLADGPSADQESATRAALESRVPLIIGTSGWQSAHWKAGFYGGQPQRTWLEHYAERFVTVESNAAGKRPVRDTCSGRFLSAAASPGNVPADAVTTTRSIVRARPPAERRPCAPRRAGRGSRPRRAGAVRTSGGSPRFAQTRQRPRARRRQG